MGPTICFQNRSWEVLPPRSWEDLPPRTPRSWEVLPPDPDPRLVRGSTSQKMEFVAEELRRATFICTTPSSTPSQPKTQPHTMQHFFAIAGTESFFLSRTKKIRRKVVGHGGRQPPVAMSHVLTILVLCHHIERDFFRPMCTHKKQLPRPSFAVCWTWTFPRSCGKTIHPRKIWKQAGAPRIRTELLYRVAGARAVPPAECGAEMISL